MTGPLVTDNSFGSYIIVVLGSVVVCIGIIAFIVMFVKMGTNDYRADDAVASICPLVVTCGGVGSVVLCVGLLGVAMNQAVLHPDRVNAAVSERYSITSVEGRAGTPQAEQLCAPVSTDSPEYVGVADGQEIRFKVGSANCASEQPKVTVIVTHTPGQMINAENLRKHHNTTDQTGGEK